MRSLGRLAILTEELSLKYSPIILTALSCLQQSSATQPDCLSDCPSNCPSEGPSDCPSDCPSECPSHCPALPQPNPQSKTVGGAPSHHVLSSEPAEADAATAAEEAAAAPDTEAFKKGDTAESAGVDQPTRSQTAGHDTHAPELQSACMHAVHTNRGSSVHAQASTAKQDSNTAGTAVPFSPSLFAAPTSKGAATLQLPPVVTAVAPPPAAVVRHLALPVLAHEPVPGTGPLGSPAPGPPGPPAAAATAVTADAVATVSAAATKAGAPQAEAVVLEAVSAAVAMVEAFPHLLEDLAEALASGLRCAIGTALEP